MMRYRNLGSYLRARYGSNVEKMCLDGGFTCPNRDGTCGTGGCIFCGERGAGEHIRGQVNVAQQVESFFRARPRAKRVIAYFQNFTGTYAPLDRLRSLYTDAIRDGRVVALAIATRPDCITEPIADLLQELSLRIDVWVELGLQTASDETAARIRRGYPTAQFDRAYALLHSRGIGVVAHVMIGLPGEGRAELDATLAYLNRFALFGIKIHSLYVMRDTELERMYLDGSYTPITVEEYVECVLHLLTHLPPDLTIHRLTGDCRRSLLVAPAWCSDKDTVLAHITRRLEERELTQGCLYSE
jgi:radical SAM protein (TIGR01212 family)